MNFSSFLDPIRAEYATALQLHPSPIKRKRDEQVWTDLVNKKVKRSLAMEEMAKNDEGGVMKQIMALSGDDLNKVKEALRLMKEKGGTM